jgi:hypothetical protein
MNPSSGTSEPNQPVLDNMSNQPVLATKMVIKTLRIANATTVTEPAVCECAVTWDISRDLSQVFTIFYVMALT